MDYQSSLLNAQFKLCLITNTTATRKFNNFMIVNFLWIILLLLSYITVIQAEPDYHVPHYWPNGNILWMKPTNTEQKYWLLPQKLINKKTSYSWPPLNGLIHAIDYTANPAYYTPQQEIVTKMILAGSNNNNNMNVIRKIPQSIQNDMTRDNNDNNKNGNYNGNTTAKPKKNGYLHPCYFKICNIAK